MAAFVRISAVLVGLANAILYGLLGDDSFGGPFDWDLQPWTLSALYALCGVMVGLLISTALLKFLRRDLRGSFFSRYGLMVLSVCFGGVAMSLLLVMITLSLDTNVMVPSTPSEVLYVVVFAVVAGGILGAIEGAAFAFPLAGFLGLFGNRQTTSP